MSVDISTIALSLASSVAGGAVVALLNHFLTVRLDSLKKLNEMKVQRRIDAWKNLEKAARIGSVNYDIETEKRLQDGFDYAFAEVMLLGTPREIELAQIHAEGASKIGNFDGLTDLLNELRSSLRAELRLEEVPSSQFYFRLKRRGGLSARLGSAVQTDEMTTSNIANVPTTDAINQRLIP